MKRFVVILLWIFSAAALASAQTTGYFPQIANGIQSDGITWKTTIYITNPAPSGSAPVSGTISFTASNGSPFNIAFVDSIGAPAGSGGTISFSITGGQTRKYVSTGAGALSIGFGTLSANGTVIGTAVFSEFTAGGALISEASVLSSGATERQAIVVDTQAGFDTGVAYANPNSGPVSITLQLLNTEGVAVVPSTQQTLAGNQQTAAFVKGGLFPTSPALAGSMQIISSAPIASVALRFSSTGLFTTLPPITLADLLYPAVQWLEQRSWLSPLSSLARLIGGLHLRIG
jgi:hypothetical protein